MATIMPAAQAINARYYDRTLLVDDVRNMVNSAQARIEAYSRLDPAARAEASYEIAGGATFEVILTGATAGTGRAISAGRWLGAAETVGGREALRAAVGRTGSLTEAKGVVFATREANRLGYDLIDAPLTYRGGQGIDLPFFNPTTGRYAVWEAKGGSTQRSLSSLSTDTLGITQGSARFIDTRLARYIRYGEGSNVNVAIDLQNARRAGNIDSFASFYGGRSTYQLPLSGAGIRPAVIVR